MLHAIRDTHSDLIRELAAADEADHGTICRRSIAAARTSALRLGAASWQVRPVTAAEAGLDGFAVERLRGGVVTDRAWVLPSLHPGVAVAALVDAAKAGIETASGVAL